MSMRLAGAKYLKTNGCAIGKINWLAFDVGHFTVFGKELMPCDYRDGSIWQCSLKMRSPDTVVSSNGIDLILTGWCFVWKPYLPHPMLLPRFYLEHVKIWSFSFFDFGEFGFHNIINLRRLFYWVEDIFNPCFDSRQLGERRTVDGLCGRRVDDDGFVGSENINRNLRYLATYYHYCDIAKKFKAFSKILDVMLGVHHPNVNLAQMSQKSCQYTACSVKFSNKLGHGHPILYECGDQIDDKASRRYLYDFEIRPDIFRETQAEFIKGAGYIGEKADDDLRVDTIGRGRVDRQRFRLPFVHQVARPYQLRSYFDLVPHG